MKEFENLIKLRQAELDAIEQLRLQKRQVLEEERQPFLTGGIVCTILFFIGFHFGFTKGDESVLSGLILRPATILLGIGVLICIIGYMWVSNKKSK
jgi:hypothetical protein